MAETLATLAEHASPAYQHTLPILEAEVAERDVRSINYQMKEAKFTAYRDLAGFVFDHSQVDEALDSVVTRFQSIAPYTGCEWTPGRRRYFWPIEWPCPATV